MSRPVASDGLDSTAAGNRFQLSPQQLEYFQTFGFLKLPGLFDNEIVRLTEGFDEVFANHEPNWVLTDDKLHQIENPTFEDRRRVIIGPFIDRSDKLQWLANDPRVTGIVTGILGEAYEALPTDGHIFHCDTSWHPDVYGLPDDGFRLKLSFYLDPQYGQSGAIRVMLGSNHDDGAYDKALMRNLYQEPSKIKDRLGVEADEIPCWIVETEPGDLVCWNRRPITPPSTASPGGVCSR